jgi:hypothetical protein
MAVQELIIYDSNDSGLTTLAKDLESGGGGTIKAEPVAKGEDVVRVIGAPSNLKQITFYTHGVPGLIMVGKVAVTALAFKDASPSLFAAGEGRVLFAGCSVGKGDRGRDFLVSSGGYLLRGHGGEVGASTVTNVAGRFGVFDIRIPLGGTLRMFRLDSLGNVLREKEF